MPFINENSRKIARSKRTTNAPVHERLHQQAIQKQKVAKREKEKSQNNTFFLPNSLDLPKRKKTQKRKVSKSFSNAKNHGTYLYDKGLQSLEMKANRHREAILREQQEEDSDLTFKPQINPISRYFGRKDNERLEDRLANCGMITKEKLEKKRSEMLFYDQNKFDFHPQVNKESERIMDEKSRYFIQEEDG